MKASYNWNSLICFNIGPYYYFYFHFYFYFYRNFYFYFYFNFHFYIYSYFIYFYFNKQLLSHYYVKVIPILDAIEGALHKMQSCLMKNSKVFSALMWSNQRYVIDILYRFCHLSYRAGWKADRGNNKPVKLVFIRLWTQDIYNISLTIGMV